MKVSIIITNWNGEAFIARALGALAAAIRSREECEILVVDDASEDRSPRIVKDNFPAVRLIRNETNLGFAAATNRGLREATGDIAILLNNDIVVRSDFVTEILRPFEADGAEDLFAVTARTLQWTTGEANHLAMNGRWRRGWVEKEWSDAEAPVPSLFIQAGACALRRETALELDGLRELYRPGYWEDYDLSYRAAKAGWRSLFAPGAVAYHLGEASFSRILGEEGLDALRLRNEILFHWANLDDSAMIGSHALALVRRAVMETARGRFAFLKALLRAAARLPEVRRVRCQRRHVCSDEDLL